MAGFLLLSAATATTKKLLKMLVRLRYQCKEMFKVPVKDHWENDASEEKKADLTNVIVTHKSSPCLENCMHSHPQKSSVNELDK